ncbi:MAG: enoyl-CoA hydratase/isomerase family protein [Desulfobacterales bacterium]|nr:enoyl-CoA hydratase/isomerase family protein [Desulfobacterales bacterium]
MNEASKLNVNCDFFTGKAVDSIAQITFKENLLLRAIDLKCKEDFFDYLDIVSKNESIKVVLITGSSKKISCEEYISFYLKLLKSDHSKEIERLYNAVNQIVLRIAGFNKMVIHADTGNIISLFLNISLACDYRIIGDNTIFKNPNIDLDVLPKGGGVFFLSKILGRGKTFEILLSRKELDAIDALKLGIVDKVVPSQEIDEASLKIASEFAQNPPHLLSGIKKLMAYCMNDLAGYLDYENEVLRRTIISSEFRAKLEILEC